MSHFFKRTANLRRWPAVGGLLALLIALSGSALQRIDEKVANNGHDIRDLRNQVSPLEDSVKRRGDNRHSGELESRIDQLVRSADKDSQQLQGLNAMGLVRGVRFQEP